MIDEMIDFAYMTADLQPKLEAATLRVAELIAETLDTCSALADTKRMRVQTHCPPDLELRANRDLLRIILANLLTNALKYSPEGSTVTITAGADGGEVCLRSSTASSRSSTARAGPGSSSATGPGWACRSSRRPWKAWGDGSR
jgi:signal transduction histidine kinase